MKRSAQLAESRRVAARSGGGGQVSGADGPGVTSTEIKVGVMVLDFSNLERALGIDVPDTGDIQAQTVALMDSINAVGGVAGRKLVPVFQPFDVFKDNQPIEEKLCKSFTQDSQVFAVVINGQLQSNTRACYANARTIMFDSTQFPLSASGFEKLAPYLYQPSYPDYGQLIGAQIRDLGETGFFEGATLGIVAIDNPQNREIFEKNAKATMDAAGVDAVEPRWIDPASGGTIQAGQKQAVLAFKEANVDRVLVIGGSRIASYMMDTASKQAWFPRFALSSWDNPDFNVKNYPKSMVGSAGVSVAPGFDLPDDAFPFPAPNEKPCIDLLSSVQQFAGRSNARIATQLCDAMFLLRDAFAGSTGPVNAEAFRAGVDRVGGGFVSASTYSSGFEPGGYTGGTGFRRMVYGDDCGCMRVEGDVVAITRDG